METLRNQINLTDEELRTIAEIGRREDESLSPYAAKDADAVYEIVTGQRDYRSNYGRDVDAVLNNVFYARFGDKTQVHSFYKNDDVTRRSLHVQYVSRIARSIGRILNLNLELIEAIAIGHDIGHTPFGHKGEEFLSELFHAEDGRYFNHNVHSVRVLKEISKRANNRGLSLQTLDGILSHNGESLRTRLTPANTRTFAEFEVKYRRCYEDNASIAHHVANTLEGCLVRVCDMLAYVGKDRQDLYNVSRARDWNKFADRGIGRTNSEIIKNCSVNLIKNSYGQNGICLGEEVAEALNYAKKENAEVIYNSQEVVSQYAIVKRMFAFIFEKILLDLKNGTDRTRVRANFQNQSYLSAYRYDIAQDKYSHALQAVDYIAAMTDDYMVDLAELLGFSEQVSYCGYFQNTPD